MERAGVERAGVERAWIEDRAWVNSAAESGYEGLGGPWWEGVSVA